jgi:Na+/proline symporter
MSFDIKVVIGFLLLNLGVGLYYGRRVKTIKDSAISERDFSTGNLVSTIVASWIGGDYLFITLSEVYTMV